MSAPELSLEEEGQKQWKADSSIYLSYQSRVESLLLAERRTLEMIAEGASLPDVLEDLCAAIDAQSPEIMSTIMLMDPDGKRLWPIAGPRVPKAWLQVVTPLVIGPEVGSCGTAAFLKQLVIVSDIASDPLWSGTPAADYREIALSHGLRAAWSKPLISKDDEVLGTFAMYYAEPRSPSDGELALVEDAGHIARIAIEREQAKQALSKALEKLRQDERELRQLIDFLPQHILVLDAGGSLLQANQMVLDYTGHTLKEMQEVETDERVRRDLHPDDFERVRSERRRGLSSGIPFEIEKRMLGKDGQYRWFLFRYKPLLDEEGRIARWFATATDIEDRKQAEQRMRNENLALREEIDRSSMSEEIVGSSEALRRVLAQVAKVAATDSTVLILGETGTGKELIARAIHKRSKRSTRAFITVNCAAIPPSLLASELFGHEKGAFTGAMQRRLGRFESADGGTIFLDEVGELPAETQLALLRVLQEREFERVGSNQLISVDIRVLAATNRDLKAAVAAGTFRQDLFYRLNVFPIEMPSLRERVDDIPLLVEYLIDRYAKAAGKKIRNMQRKTLDLFQAYDWPGNIRELQNVVERAVILSDGETFSVDETWLKRDADEPSGPTIPFAATLVEREREMIEAALAECRGRISGPSGAAARLGIPRQTLDSKIKALQINKHRFRTV